MAPAPGESPGEANEGGSGGLHVDELTDGDPDDGWASPDAAEEEAAPMEGLGGQDSDARDDVELGQAGAPEQGQAAGQGPEPGPSPEPDPGEVLDLLSEISASFAWITISGELPGLLDGFAPQPLDDWLDWDFFYRIPRDVAGALIDEISGSDGATVEYVNSGSDYAIVLHLVGLT